tara:strand:+ start:1208 stop:2368 length:1161 start_codon:yes stop_codon:yes gene_type:complete
MNNTIINYTFLFLAILTGSYLCILGGYGSDEDTLPMIGTFTNLLNGHFMTSRFTGYPVAEFIIGFFSYFFGSAVINLIIFFSFILGSVIFYLSFESKIRLENLVFFLIFLISNPILFFDNLEPIDYSLAFLFFSLGYFFLVKQKFELSVIFFGICIGTRINFAPFVLIIILFYNENFLNNYFRKFSIIICSLFIGCLFYLPVWINSGLGFDWLRAGRPDGGFIEYFARFLYKTINTVGLFQLLIIIFSVNLFFENLKKNRFSKMLICLIVANLGIFIYIPAELSYLQPMLIFLYYLIFKISKPKYIYFIIIINIVTWFTYFDYLKIEYKYKEPCDPTVATGASFKPQMKKGYLFNFLDTRSNIECWININSVEGKKIRQGKPFREM